VGKGAADLLLREGRRVVVVLESAAVLSVVFEKMVGALRVLEALMSDISSRRE